MPGPALWMKSYAYHSYRPAYLIRHSEKSATILANYSTLSSPGDSMKTVLKYGDLGLGDVVCSVEPEIIKAPGRIPIACTCHCGHKVCCLSQSQATFIVGILSVVSLYSFKPVLHNV